MATTFSPLDRITAERIIESLRFGVPPTGFVRAFTVGRDEQLRKLEASLDGGPDGRSGALLVKANYGAGKSHLLHVVREAALEARYAVSLVEVSSQEGVRFNRMDTIFGAVCRELEVDDSGRKGVGPLFDAFESAEPHALRPETREMRSRISHNTKWDHSDLLPSSALYVALRAWSTSSNQEVRSLIEDWLSNPANYRGQRKLLYEQLVWNLRDRFRDPRAEWQFYADEVFAFHTGGHRQAWDGLASLDMISRASGLRGLVLLFDEFEDVIQNLPRVDYKQQAFFNLFRFFSGEKFPGMAYFAVTPDFAAKCKKELLRKGVYEFPNHLFDQLTYFEMEEITKEQFRDLATRIRVTHGAAYGWDPQSSLTDSGLRRLTDSLWAVSTPERVRRGVQRLIEVLDARLNGQA